MQLKDLLKGLKVKKIYGKRNREIESIAYNSKNVTSQSLFVCLVGSKYDGKDFVNEAILKGATVIVSEQTMTDWQKDITYIEVTNSRNALAKISMNYFHSPSNQVLLIGFTGTKGKTTSSFMLKQILEDHGLNVGLIGTNGVYYQNQHLLLKNTTPESYEIHYYLNEMVKNKVQIVLMEVSSLAYKFNRIAYLTFDLLVYTNLYPDHISSLEHEDFEDYKQCKKGIIKQAKICFYNQNDPYASYMKTNVKTKMIPYSLNEIQAIEYVQKEKLGMQFIYQNKLYFIPFPGKFNICNALCSIKVADYLNIPKEEIVKSLAKVKIEGRFEYVKTYPGVKVYIDFAHNAYSMECLLKTCLHYHPKRLIVVFGCGGQRDKKRRYEMGRIAGMNASLTILTADNSRYEKTTDIIQEIIKGVKEVNGNYLVIENRKNALEYALQIAKVGDMIMILGKGHEKYQDLSGIKYQFNEKQILLDYLNKE